MWRCKFVAEGLTQVVKGKHEVKNVQVGEAKACAE